MTRPKFISQFHIHPLLWLVLFLGVITGSFVEIAIIFFLIFIHEMGHVGMALFFRWRITNVMFWPFGGVMDTEEYFTRSYKEEFLVVLAGPLQHIWIHVLLTQLVEIELFPVYLLEYAIVYNLQLLLFNLLPIYPLDGGRILLLLLSYKVPFKKVLGYTIYLSVLCILIGLSIATVNHWLTFHTLLLAGFLFIENRLEWKRKHYVFIRHLMARYHQPQSHSNRNLLVPASSSDTVNEVLQKFYKGRHHQIHVQFDTESSATVEEAQCLRAFFERKSPHLQMRELTKIGYT
ncbi:stage IV sporulation protein FB [Virgibacillus sp. MSP4-1]|uniref:site-2 protease family protein n=1 Tax=Virgibacillus sp. MSP4-1 TaxID=2700081 RepID=UPI0003A6AEC1|nr:site-2 protease family protein [Virgibacillus sp. MSP4-1]QHS22901.1 stage IV sporulation protein FB [Virgibacillus sp. MSP4-1]